MKAVVIDEGLAFGKNVFIHIAHADSTADSTNLRIGEAGYQFPNRIGMEDAIAVNRQDDLRLGTLQCCKHRARLATVLSVLGDTDWDVGKVPLGLQKPNVAIVARAVISGDNFKQLIRIVAFRNAFHGLVDGFAFVVAG
jgi:hypothetical protein